MVQVIYNLQLEANPSKEDQRHLDSILTGEHLTILTAKTINVS